MTADEALEYQRNGGKLAEDVEFNRSLKYEGPLYITNIPALAQGGPGDDSKTITIPEYHLRSKR